MNNTGMINFLVSIYFIIPREKTVLEKNWGSFNLPSNSMTQVLPVTCIYVDESGIAFDGL